MSVCIVVVVVVVEIITLYPVQPGRFLAAIGYVAPSPNNVQYSVPMSNSTYECVYVRAHTLYSLYLGTRGIKQPSDLVEIPLDIAIPSSATDAIF